MDTGEVQARPGNMRIIAYTLGKNFWLLVRSSTAELPIVLGGLHRLYCIAESLPNTSLPLRWEPTGIYWPTEG